MRKLPTYQIFELTPRLLNDTILASKDDAHSRQVANFSLTDDQGVCEQ
jgi:hypothetical protein